MRYLILLSPSPAFSSAILYIVIFLTIAFSSTVYVYTSMYLAFLFYYFLLWWFDCTVYFPPAHNFPFSVAFSFIPMRFLSIAFSLISCFPFPVYCFLFHNLCWVSFSMYHPLFLVFLLFLLISVNIRLLVHTFLFLLLCILLFLSIAPSQYCIFLFNYFASSQYLAFSYFVLILISVASPLYLAFPVFCLLSNSCFSFLLLSPNLLYI